MNDVREISAGDIQVWIEQGHSICLKAEARFGDPVELSVDEARELVAVLLEMISVINASDCVQE
jgi:hypothetical protein